MKEFLLDGKPVLYYLMEYSKNGMKDFAQSLNPGVENVMGIRMPDLRSLAHRIVKSDWEQYLDTTSSFYMEERMLYGIVLGYIKPDNDIEIYLSRVSRFVSIINSWSVCDTFRFAGGKKYFNKHSERLWEFVKSYMQSKSEYEIRFGVVMSLFYFIDEAHIDELLSFIDEISHEGYYVKMAVAWAVSFCFIKFPVRTMDFLKNCSLDDFTYNKSLQKILESYRVDKEMKDVIKSMKRK